MPPKDRQSMISRGSFGRSSIGGTQLQNQWLVVFPYELEFTAPVDSCTVFYFEKNYQLIGDLRKTFSACSEPTKYRFDSLDNLISFRLFSLNNLNYKWVMYQLYDTGQQQYLQEFELDLRSQIADQIITPATSQGSHIQDKSIIMGMISKELQGRFNNNGVILKYKLFVNDDLSVIEESIKDFIKSQQSRIKQTVKSQLEVTPSNANIEVSSHMANQQMPSNQHIKQTTPNNTEVEPEAEKNQQVAQPIVESAIQIQQVPAPQTEMQIKQEVKEEPKEEAKPPSLLKLESKQAQLKNQEPLNPGPESLQIVTEEPQRTSLYTPAEETPAPESQKTQEEVTPAQEIPQNPVTAQKSIEPVSSSAASIDLKKVIIVLLLIIVGMLGVVVFRGTGKEQKESKVKKSPKASNMKKKQKSK